MNEEFEAAYKTFVKTVLDYGEKRESRVGRVYQTFGTCFITNALVFGKFPILTGRRIYYKAILGELTAFLEGAEDLATFQDRGCNYWNANAMTWGPNAHRDPENYQVGRIYGAQWRKWYRGRDKAPVDQIRELVQSINRDPYGRRHMLTAWNPGELDMMCLPPCHTHAQFNVFQQNQQLDIIVYMRSVDLCLGFPADIVLYAALLILVAKETKYAPGKICFMLGDTHVYENHVNMFDEYMKQPVYELPAWAITPTTSLDSFVPDHFILPDYKHGYGIQFPLNV